METQKRYINASDFIPTGTTGNSTKDFSFRELGKMNVFELFIERQHTKQMIEKAENILRTQYNAGDIIHLIGV